MVGRERFLGSDRVVAGDEGELLVYATEMDGWRPRKFRRLAILYESTRYYVAEVTRLNPRMQRYRLVRWPDSLTDLAGGEVVYDDAMVSARDAAHSERAQRSRGRRMLWAFQPIWGLRWSTTKRMLHERFGFHGRRINLYSLFFEWTVILFCFPLIMLSPIVAMTSPALAFALMLISPVLLIDFVMRGVDHFRDEVLYPYGMFEWLLRRRGPEERE